MNHPPHTKWSKARNFICDCPEMWVTPMGTKCEKCGAIKGIWKLRNKKKIKKVKKIKKYVKK